MAYQVFLVPSVAEQEQATIWQLQMLAESYDVTIKTSRRTGHTRLSAADAAEIRRSDVVVAIVTSPMGERARAELAEARKARKRIFQLVEKSIARTNGGRSSSVIAFDRDERIEAIAEKIHVVIERARTSEEAGRTVGWLLGIGVALLVLNALARERA